MMPIEWAQEPRFATAGYGDILIYVRRYHRLDTYDLILSSYENLDISMSPEKREHWLDEHILRGRKSYIPHRSRT